MKKPALKVVAVFDYASLKLTLFYNRTTAEKFASELRAKKLGQVKVSSNHGVYDSFTEPIGANL